MASSSTSAGPRLGSVILAALRHVVSVALTGMALATVFISWTPGSSSDLLARLAAALDTRRVTSMQTATPPPLTATPSFLPRLGLVAGHKGNDSGAVCSDGLTEASVNLDIAQRVKAGLEASGFQVDVLDEFDQRLEGYDALALVSIHNDSCDYINDQATGYKVAGALNAAARENSERLVGCLVDRYPRQTGLTYHAHSITPDMTNYHSFYEVKETTPVAIIETGFLNLDRKILTEEPYRVAQGIIDGMLCYVMNQPLAATATPAP